MSAYSTTAAKNSLSKTVRKCRNHFQTQHIYYSTFYEKSQVFFYKHTFCTLTAVRACVHRKCVRIFEQILLQTRQKFAGILGVWQEFLTQYAAKFAEKTQADAYAHKL